MFPRSFFFLLLCGPIAFLKNGVDAFDSESAGDTIEEQGSSLLRQAQQLSIILKANHKELIKYSGAGGKLDLVNFVQVALDQRLAAMGLVHSTNMINLIVMYFDLLLYFERPSWIQFCAKKMEWEILKDFKTKINKFIKLNREAMISRKRFRDGSNHLCVDCPITYFVDELDVKILNQFIDTCQEKEIRQKLKATNIREEIRNWYLDHGPRDLSSVADCAKFDLPEHISNHLGFYKFEKLQLAERYSEATGKLISKAEEIWKISSTLELVIWLVGFCFLLLPLFFAFFCCLIYKKCLKSRVKIKKEIINKFNKQKNMNKKARNAQKKVEQKVENKKINNAKEIKANSSIIAWVDLVPNVWQLFNKLMGRKQLSIEAQTEHHEDTHKEGDQVNAKQPKRIASKSYTPEMCKSILQEGFCKNESNNNVLKSVLQIKNPEASSPSKLCWNCSETQVRLFKCSGCRKARYCSQSCIEQDWGQHGTYCVKVQKKNRNKKS